ncbi:sodium-coupled monocarboxylate transporter 1-like [Penaeus japonicus]|uniref:sodium-coupled monocarboxylate transporter 1-like n=1 Tax=Penaeus japonicus TaxID=27405 RepID=UPI001C7111AA|nr:sodium-coupled monocarboxylate transporter 1-like [Penaeus japonicus]
MPSLNATEGGSSSDQDALASFSRFSTVDYAIFILLLVSSMLVGTFSGWRSNKRDAKDFLTGGRNMNPIAVVMSLLGGVVSALSVLGNATEIYLYGTQLWVNLLGCIYGAVFVIFVLLPVFYPLCLATMNEYLQMRFNSPILRKLGSLTQIVNSAMYLGICLYAPSLTLSSVTKLPVWVAIVSLGIICSVYISLGGVRAVVYTDVLQTTVMFVGVLAVVMQVCIDLGGLGEVWDRAIEGGRIEFFNFDPSLPGRNSGRVEKRILNSFSSLSSQANAMVVLLWEDFLSDWWIFRDISQERATTITRVLSSCMGLLGIGVAFLVANLGTLFQMAYSISGALVSPMDGLFVTAIIAPWVNSKGAIAGFVSALTFNLWLVIGKFVFKAGNSEKLPLSTEGCLAEDVLVGGALNGTSVFVNGTDYVTLTTTAAVPVDQLAVERDYFWAYDISYCYIGSMGILIVVAVSTLVSLITGVNKPSEVDESLVNKRCLNVYRWLYKSIFGNRSSGLEIETVHVTKGGIDNRANDVSTEANGFTDVDLELKSVK